MTVQELLTFLQHTAANGSNDFLKAAQAGITYAEALRRALDEWLAAQEGQSMSDASRTTSAVTSTVYVKLVGDDQPCRWRNATIEEDYNGNIEVYRGERKIAHFSAKDVSSWYVAED
jgi:hypothetical protein